MLRSDMSRAEYDAIKAENFSVLKLMGKSPAAYRYRKDNPPGPDSDAMLRGRLTHLSVFEPELLANVAVWEGRRAGKEWERFVADNKGREVSPLGIFEDARAIGAAVRKDAHAAALIEGCEFEVSMTWAVTQPEEDGAPGWGYRLKGRADAIKPGLIVDLKTTRDASPDAFGRAAWAMSYHAQAALYCDGYEATTARDASYHLIAVETAAPYAVQVYEVEDWLIDMGRDTYRGWLSRLAECERNKSWPAYGTGPMPLRVPRWAVPQEDEDAAGLGLDFGTNNESEE